MENVDISRMDVKIKDSILKEILKHKECSFGKYLSVSYFTEKNGNNTDYYITPAVTISKKQILIITRLVKGNWFESIRIINDLISDVSFKYDMKIEEYTIILHAFFDEIGLEQFYEVDIRDGSSLHKLPFGEFENLLS